jgi:MATE family multidrug resistance protein
LSIWLVGGGAGVPALGAVGCAWATLAVNLALLAMSVAMLQTQKLYRPFLIWQPLERPDVTQLRQFLRLGLPAGLAYLVEVTSLTLMALFIARLGVIASASHQIAASVAAVLYMMPLSIAIAASSRVSFWLGAGNAIQARRVVLMSLGLSAITALTLCASLFIASTRVARWYSPNPEIVMLGASLLAWVAAFHLADSTQALCAFLLRCYRITVVPLLLYGVLLWGLGLYGGYVLTYRGIPGFHAATQSPVSFWIATAVATGLVATSLLLLLWWAVRRSLEDRDADAAGVR